MEKTTKPSGKIRLKGQKIKTEPSLTKEQGEDISLLVMLDAYPNHFLPIKDAPDEQEALIALLALGGYDPDSLDGAPAF